MSVLQPILEQRGYIVVATRLTLKIGQVVPVPVAPKSEDKADGVVISQTDRADFVQQCKLLQLDPWLDQVNIPNYYRVVAE